MSGKVLELFVEVCEESSRKFPDIITSKFIDYVEELPGNVWIESRLVTERHIPADFRMEFVAGGALPMIPFEHVLEIPK